MRTVPLMITLSPTLEAHQKASGRKPSIALSSQAMRAGAHLFRWQRWYTGVEADSPHAAAMPADGSLLRARNEAGNLRVSRVVTPNPISVFSTWTLLQAGLVVGSGVALAARNTEAIILYTRGVQLFVRTSVDSGATWGAETLLLTEGAAIGFIGVAYRASTGNACAFYNVGAAVKRLRRTAGVWEAAGTAWTNSIASVSGIAAAHDGSDFTVLVSGVGTGNNKRVWAAVMGDGGFPLNTWSTLTNVAESDLTSTTTFAGPAVLQFTGAPAHAAYSHIEAANVPYSRAYQTHAPAGDSFLGTWMEPEPHEAVTANGLVLAWPGGVGPATAIATTPSGVWGAQFVGATNDLSARLLKASVRHTPTSLRATFELNNADGLLNNAPNIDTPSLMVGGQLTFLPGYASGVGGTFQGGATWNFTVDRLTHRLKDGSRWVTVEASGPWEQLARWQAPQAWQVATGIQTRDAIFRRLAGRAGFPGYVGSGVFAPSADWAAHFPSFALQQGQAGDTALKALLAAVNDGCQSNTNRFTIVGLTAPGGSTYTYGDSPTSHVIAALTLRDEPPAHNWVRLAGTGRYADASDFASLYQHGSRRRWLRQLDATSNVKASAFAVNALRRDQWGEAMGELTVAYNAGQELFDIITVQQGLVGTQYRVLGLGIEYAAGPAGTRYDTIITLGAQ
jgi:hypothetical protein